MEFQQQIQIFHEKKKKLKAIIEMDLGWSGVSQTISNAIKRSDKKRV